MSSNSQKREIEILESIASRLGHIWLDLGELRLVDDKALNLVRSLIDDSYRFIKGEIKRLDVESDIHKEEKAAGESYE